MKQRYWILLLCFLLFLLSACTAAPAETTAPPATEPPATHPAQTEPASPETAEPARVEAVDYGPHFQNMTLKDIQYWFCDFALLYRLDEMPTLDPKYGPSMHAGTYAYWVYFCDPEQFRGDPIEIPRAVLDEQVLTHFGIVPEIYKTDPHTWAYDNEREVFSYGTYLPYMTDHWYYMLHSIEYEDGVYTVRATAYLSRFDDDREEMVLELKRQMFQGITQKLNPSAEITLSFRLDPDTLEPVFHSYTKDSYHDYPKV